MGYHPGTEDDAVYLAAVKHDLQPQLFPHDAPFFETQLQATAFDKVIAESLRITHLPVAWGELLWQCFSILLVMAAGFLILRRLFCSPVAQWAGVAMLGAMFTLPVSGTDLYIMDQHLHPRALATGLILLAVDRVMARRYWITVPLLLAAFLLHPIMGALGISFCFFLALAQIDRVRNRAAQFVEKRELTHAAMALTPLGWIFERPTETWRQTIQTRTYFFLYRWEWYEWLGAIAPLILFWLLARWAQKRGDKTLAQFAWGVLAFGIFQQLVAMVITGPDALIRLIPLQPMRYLHLVYIMMTLIGGALIGQYLLKARVWRWVVFLILINAGMFISQRQLFAGVPTSRWIPATWSPTVRTTTASAPSPSAVCSPMPSKTPPSPHRFPNSPPSGATSRRHNPAGTTSSSPTISASNPYMASTGSSSPSPPLPVSIANGTMLSLPPAASRKMLGVIISSS